MRWFILGIALFLGAQSRAEIGVRSGEHPTFTRLVFSMPSQMGWSVVEDVHNVIVEVADRRQIFDVKGVFDRIPRTRLSAIRPISNGAIRLDLACDCAVRTFAFGPSRFVVDIVEARDAALPPRGEQEQSNTLLEDFAAHIRHWPIDPTTANALMIAAGPRPSVPPLGFANMDAGAHRNNAVTGVRKALQTEINDAVGRQLISRAPNTTLTHHPDATGYRNIKVKSAIDESLEALFSDRLPQTEIKTCVGDDEIDLGKWAPTQGVGADIGRLRRKLYNDLDRVDRDAAQSLAKLYLHLGFGIEALNFLELNGDDNGPLHTIAEVIAFDSAQTFNAFENQQDCDGGAALWSVLASASLPANAQINQDAMTAAFSALPKHLRTHLGPILSERLRHGGQLPLSKNIMRIVERGVETIDDTAAMEIAQIKKSAGDKDDAVSDFEQVVRSDGPPSPEALVELIDSRIADQEPVDPDLATLVAAYRFEFREGDLGRDLSRAHILALADANLFSEAITELTLMRAIDQDGPQGDVVNPVYRLLTHNGSDETFLEEVLSHPMPDGLDEPVRLQIADRLLDLNISQRVKPLLDFSASDVGRGKQRVLAARLHLLEGDPGAALGSIVGLQDAEANKIRVKALTDLGKFDQVDQVSLGVTDAQQRDNTAFLARDWARLREASVPVLNDLAELRETPRAVTRGAPNLASARSLLEESSSTHRLVNDLLAAFQPEPFEF